MSQSEDDSSLFQISIRLHEVYQEAYAWCKDARPLGHPWEWERHALVMVRKHVLTETDGALHAGHYGALTVEIPSALDEVSRRKAGEE